ncbi:MAG: flagellar hook-basal body complex protein FliE [Oscillospiraceae bacterium]|nr:flagellar hook-basal body complex protein FliE [Oscillospiraceae bacterium]
MYIVPLSQLSSISPINQTQTDTQVNAQPSGFSDILKEAMKNVEETQKVSAQDAYALALGETDDLHTVQINSMKATAAVELTAGVTSRVLSAYKEIMSLQI